LLYLPLEFYVQSRSVLTNLYGYGIGTHTLSNLVQYLAALAFPWGLPEPINYIWLVFALTLFLFFSIVQPNARLLFLGIFAVLAFLPVINFPWFFTRYLYMSVMATAVLVGILIDQTWARLARRRWLAVIPVVAIAFIALWNSAGVANAAADFAELARQTRVPFRDVSQRHPTFPADTYLYFVDPPTITSQLSGMFFLRYGLGITVSSNVSADSQPADLRQHANPYVIYFDERQATREIPVEAQWSVDARPTLPVDFGASIRLTGYEMPSARAKRGGAIVVILYWQATGRVERDYVVSARLIDSTHRVVSESTSEPRNGTAPTSGWQPGVNRVDARVLLVAPTAAPGDNYQLEIGMIDPATVQRLPISSAPDAPARDAVVIAPIAIDE
ncbi:MAG: hypothetical protein KGJ80_11600, partial [Chloroflexota bacterium]|nr:hypothetical protein [Chloroflexota bacterium]